MEGELSFSTTHYVDVVRGAASGRWELDAGAGTLRRLAHQRTVVFRLDDACRAALAAAR